MRASYTNWHAEKAPYRRCNNAKYHSTGVCPPTWPLALTSRSERTHPLVEGLRSGGEAGVAGK